MTTTRADADYWAGYRFRPRLVAATESAAWVMEDHLPLLVRIDPDGSPSEPHLIGRRDDSIRGAHELVATADAVWIRWNDGVTRLDQSGWAERWLPLSAASLAAGDAGVWALSGDGRVVRIDPDGGDYVTLGRAEVRRHTIAVGHGAVWTLTWTSVPGASTLSRVDALSGRATAQLGIEGSPRGLLTDSGAVWVRVLRDREEILVGVDPESAQASGEIAVSPTGSGGPVLDGVLWASGVDPYAHHERREPSTVRRIDARTGHLLGVVEVPGEVTGMTAGPAGIWGCLERGGQAGGAVIELAAHGVDVRVVELGALDVSAFVPTGIGRS